MEGWIRSYRKMFDNPIITKDAEYLAVWIYLLHYATHTGYDTLFGSQRITLKPGQLITSRRSIADKLRISESKVQRILKTFEIEQQIEQQVTRQNRLISLLNWERYQKSEPQSEPQVNHDRTTTEPQVNTNNNVIKNDSPNETNNEENGITNISPQKKREAEAEELFQELWKLYPRKMGKNSVQKSKKLEILKEGFDRMSRAIERFRKDMEGRNIEYIMYGSTFFNSGYLDYLDENYTGTGQSYNTGNKIGTIQTTLLD